MKAIDHPPAPEWLGDVGRAKWTEFLNQLPAFDTDDAGTLALLCASWENFLTALAEVRENGQTLMGDKGRSFINPACNIIAEERKSILKISKLFGLAPDPKGRAAAADTSKWGGLVDQ